MWTARVAAIVVPEERPCAARGRLLRVLRAREGASSTKRPPDPSTAAGAHRGDPIHLRATQRQRPLQLCIEALATQVGAAGKAYDAGRRPGTPRWDSSPLPDDFHLDQRTVTTGTLTKKCTT
jgi:hypothetical protein